MMDWAPPAVVKMREPVVIEVRCDAYTLRVKVTKEFGRVRMEVQCRSLSREMLSGVSEWRCATSRKYWRLGREFVRAATHQLDICGVS